MHRPSALTRVEHHAGVTLGDAHADIWLPPSGVRRRAKVLLEGGLLERPPMLAPAARLMAASGLVIVAHEAERRSVQALRNPMGARVLGAHSVMHTFDGEQAAGRDKRLDWILQGHSLGAIVISLLALLEQQEGNHSIERVDLISPAGRTNGQRPMEQIWTPRNVYHVLREEVRVMSDATNSGGVLKEAVKTIFQDPILAAREAAVASTADIRPMLLEMDDVGIDYRIAYGRWDGLIPCPAVLDENSQIIDTGHLGHELWPREVTGFSLAA